MDVLTPEALRDYARNERRVVIFDLETTGLHADADIIEIGAYDYATDTSWSALAKPQRYRARDTEKITGISDDMVEHAPSLAEVLEEFDKRYNIRETIFVAHNGRRFDVPRINNALEREGFGSELRVSMERFADSLNVAHHVIPWQDITSHSLTSLINHYGITGSQEHRAGSDCEFNAKVLDALLVGANESGRPITDIQYMIECSRYATRPTGAQKRAREILKMVNGLEDAGVDVDDPRYRSAKDVYDKICKEL